MTGVTLWLHTRCQISLCHITILWYSSSTARTVCRVSYSQAGAQGFKLCSEHVVFLHLTLVPSVVIVTLLCCAWHDVLLFINVSVVWEFKDKLWEVGSMSQDQFMIVCISPGSSFGRAPDLQPGGHGFKTYSGHSFSEPCNISPTSL